MPGYIFGVLAGLVGLASPAFAAPPTPQSTASAGVQSSLQQDARLGKKVSLRLRKSPLSTVLAELGRQTGVALTASPEVADEPAIMFVTDQPAREVMHHLATLFNFRWTRKGEGDQAGYELHQDLKSRQEEEALRQREVREALAGLQRALRARMDLARRSPEALNQAAEALAAEEKALDAKRRAAPPGLKQPARDGPVEASLRRSLTLSTEDVRLRTMADPLQRALLHVAASLTPAQWDSLRDGQALLFSTRQEEGALRLPAALAQELRGARLKWGEPHIQYIHDSPEEEARFKQMEAELQQGWTSAEAIRVSIWLEVAPRAYGTLDLVLRPGEAPSRLAVLQVVPAAQPAADVHPRHSSVPAGLKVASQEVPEAPKLKPDGGKTAAAGARERSPATDPILGIKRRFSLKLKFADPDRGPSRFQFLNEVLPLIAERYGINLIADAYRQRFPFWPPHPSGEELTLQELLDRTILPGARWSREGEFIHVRRWTWYDDRLAEIPERLVKQWTDRLRSQPRLSLEDAAALALALRDEQLDSFEAVMREQGLAFSGVNLDPGVEPFVSAFVQMKAILRAYGSLSPAQRQSLQAGQPVSWAAMPLKAREHLLAGFGERLRLPADPFDHRRWLNALPLITAGPPLALRYAAVTTSDNDPSGKAFVRHDFDLQFREDANPTDFYFFSPRIELKPLPASAVVLTDSNPAPAVPGGAGDRG
jgi:hypothetical protein